MFNRFASQTLPLCIGAMFFLPFVWPLHSAPIPSFYAEWIAALVLLIACCFSLRLNTREEPSFSLPVISLLFLAMAVVVLLQLNLRMLTYAYTAIFAILMLLLAFMAAILGSASARTLGLNKLLFWISIAAIAGGLVSFAIQVVQLYGVEEWFSPLIGKSPIKKIFYYGNLAQPNQLATFLSWSLICTLYLYCKRLLALRYALPIIIAFLAALALTGSRMSWLQVTWIAVAGSFMLWRFPSAERPRHWYLVAGLPLYYLLVTLALPYIGKIANFSFELSALDRATADTLDVGRRVIYAQAWELFTRHPLLGIGIGQLEFNQFLLLDQHEKTLLASSAHNLVLDLLAMTGLTGTAIFIGFIAVWASGLGKIRGTFETGTVLLMLTVLGVHALLEFPQWYGYFLWPAAFFLGCLESRTIEIRRIGMIRVAPAICTIAGLALCVFFYREYLYIEAINQRFNAKNASNDIHAPVIESIALVEAYQSTFFSPQIEALISVTLPLDSVDLAQKLEISQRAMRFNLSTALLFRHMAWLAMAGREEEAMLHLERMARLRSKHLPAIAGDLKLLEKAYPTKFARLVAKANNLSAATGQKL